jgi:hypothetical protein
MEGTQALLSSNWQPYECGRTIGCLGVERGVILLDEEHPAGARITLERDGQAAPFAITCGLEGWFVHTVFFPSEAEAQDAFKLMKRELERIAAFVPSASNFTEQQTKAVKQAIKGFVTRFD